MDVYQLADLLVQKLDESKTIWYNLLPTIAVIFSAFGAAYWAKRSIKAHEAIAKKRNTMDFVMERSRDEKFVESWSFLRQLHKAPKVDMKLFADPSSEIELDGICNDSGKQITCKEARDRISYVLNQYEYMATGINKSVYDEEILISTSKTSTIQAYSMTKVYIEELRERRKKPTAYIGIEKLVNEWKQAS